MLVYIQGDLWFCDIYLRAIAVVPKIFRVAAPFLIKILPWRATLSKGMTNHEYVINQTLLNEFVHLLLKLPHRFSIYEACSLQALYQQGSFMVEKMSEDQKKNCCKMDLTSYCGKTVALNLKRPEFFL